MKTINTTDSRPFAVFDIDGTLIRWQLFHAMADALFDQGALNKTKYKSVAAAKAKWKRRIEASTYKDYEAQLVDLIDSSLPGLSLEALDSAALAVFKEYKDQVNTFCRDLIRELKSKDYLIFAISGSPSNIVKLLAKYYGIDDFAATNYLHKDGYLTGQVELSVGNKPELLTKLIRKHGVDRSASVGVGDSEGDISMLQMVESPIALNPSKLLFEHAKANGWPIVIERKNMIYRLEMRDGTYQLA
ncbi:MAG: HAD-IB family hydrolase [Candidatus Saccharimonadales bacterium]